MSSASGSGLLLMLYFAAATLGVDGGLMVTGSHNPPDHNGFKMVMLGKPFFGPAIQRLAQTRRDAGTRLRTRGGIVTQRTVFADYLDRIQHDYDGAKLLKVAWDPGNGATGDADRGADPGAAGRTMLINTKIDGTFPPTTPTRRFPKPGAAPGVVAKEHCDLGIAFDGDGDRIGVVDAQGRILWGDQLMMVLARDVLANLPGAQILADVKASQVLFDEVARLGGGPVMAPTGHSRIKSLMAETGAPLAGEMSGHIFFADRYYGYDDAIYVAVRLLGIFARSEKTLSRWSTNCRG